jgi:flagella basal body P-ring formation protein FlgA
MPKPYLPLLTLLLLPLSGLAAANPILDAAESYTRLQTQGLPGTVSIAVGQLGPGSQLPPCERLEAYTPPGSRLWGKTNIGIRCLGPNTWTVLVPVHIHVTANYLTTAHSLTTGQTIQAADLTTVSGDLTALPSGVVTEPANAIGKTAKNSMAANQPLRNDLLLAPLVIRQGQSVRIISKGEGFSVSGEGKAINNASTGQVAQIRMPSGQIVSGVARSDGTAEISY